MVEFRNYHPLVIINYFIIAFTLLIIFDHPILIASNLGSALLFNYQVNRGLVKKIPYYILVILTISLVNMIFNHNGSTPIFYINDNAITIEAFVYGFKFGLVLVSSMLWFTNLLVVLDSEKIIYLFAKLYKSIGLIISMILRFVPCFINHYQTILEQTSFEFSKKKASTWDKLRYSLKNYSILITWAFENALVSANSMHARGYGLKNRTHFHLYTYEKRDLLYQVLLNSLVILMISASKLIDLTFYYYPSISKIEFNNKIIFVCFIYSLILVLPIIIEAISIVYYQSRIRGVSR